MSDTSARPSDLEPPASSKKACDACRIRKVRCDRCSPCSHCRRSKTQCKVSPRVERPKRRREVYSTQYQGKIDQLDQRLGQVDRLVEALLAKEQTDRMTGDIESPTASLPSHFTSSPNQTELPADVNVLEGLTALPLRSESHKSRQAGRGSKAKSSRQEEGHAPEEGPSSLSAHSSFAIDFLHHFANSDSGSGLSIETQGLLESLRQIVNALKDQPLSPALLFPMAKPGVSEGHEPGHMPPIQAAVEIIQKAQELGDTMLGFVSRVLHTQSISDLCLRIYFSKDSTSAEYIIVNMVLYNLWRDADLSKDEQVERRDVQCRYAAICQANLETALSDLSLHLTPAHDLVLALLLGSMYATDNSKPSLAWSLICAAYQASHALGFHTRLKGAKEGQEVPNQKGLLFWAIYVMEKFLSLRFGRCSAIRDVEITIPLPSSNKKTEMTIMEYCRQMVEFAGIAGRTFEDLYSAHSLSLPRETRTMRVLTLNEEISKVHSECLDTTALLSQFATNQYAKRFIEHMSICDQVLLFSVTALIHRTDTPQTGSMTAFTDQCIISARKALECHQSFVETFGQYFGLGSSQYISYYVNWTILFSPFVPFIVLFCHVIETGNESDLGRMQDFVRSMQSTSDQSNTIANHFRLFQVFHSVAVRYTELKLAPVPLRAEQLEFRDEMDGFLRTMGFRASNDVSAPQSSVASAENPVKSPYHVHTAQSMDLGGGVEMAVQVPHPENWFTVGQQMMDLLATDQLQL